MNSQHSVQTDVAESDMGVVVDVSQDEMSVKFSCCKGEFIVANQSITPPWLEIKDLILSARKMDEISAASSFDGVVTLSTFDGVIS